MDTILQALLSWQFLFFCLAIGAVVFVIRLLVEYWMQNWWPLKQWSAANKESKVWRSLILPILPISLGLLGALVAKQYPYPEGITSTSARMAFGLVGGFTSSLIVRLYVAFLSSKVSEFRDKVNTMLNNRGPASDEKFEAATTAKDMVNDAEVIADAKTDAAKEVATTKVDAAKVVADKMVSDAKDVAATKLDNTNLESLESSVRDSIKKDQ